MTSLETASITFSTFLSFLRAVVDWCRPKIRVEICITSFVMLATKETAEVPEMRNRKFLINSSNGYLEAELNHRQQSLKLHFELQN